MAWRPLFRCCNLAPGTQSQLRPDCKCAYTRSHQDSATMEVQTHFRQVEIAPSLRNDSAIMRARFCSDRVAMLSRVGDGVEGVPNDFHLAGCADQTAQPVVACLQHFTVRGDFE